MSGCDDVRPRAAYLAALAPGDPEREEAYLHARGCPDCARALREGEHLRELLEAMPAPPAPSPEALRRASEAILAELEASRAPLGPWAGTLPLGAVFGFALLVLLARQRVLEGGAWAAALSVLLLAAMAALAAPWKRAPAKLAAAGVAAVSLAFALAAGAGGSLSPLLGAKCVLLEQLAAALPFAAIAWLVRQRGAQAGPLAFALAAAAGALAGQAGLHLTCPARHATPHLLAFHLGGVLLAAALGAIASRLPALARAT